MYAEIGRTGTPTGYATAWTLNAWNHFVLTADGTNLKTYVNGTLISTLANTALTTGSSATTYLGSDVENDTLNGKLDEVRLSSSVRSADWIKTEYNNQVGTSTFYSTGTINAPANAVITAVSTFTITATWPAATIGSDYDLDASTASDFSGTVFSSFTFNTARLRLP